MLATAFVRYGSIPEVARFRVDLDPHPLRGAAVVVQSQRGIEIGTLLRMVKRAENDAPAESDFRLLRRASAEDERIARQIREECRQEFETWQQRIAGWNLELELVDLERTLDREKLILYVLNDRGSDCTKLALFAAAGGFGIVEVQPVNSDGQVSQPGGGGCGQCGSH